MSEALSIFYSAVCRSQHCQEFLWLNRPETSQGFFIHGLGPRAWGPPCAPPLFHAYCTHTGCAMHCIVNSLVVILLHTHPNFILVFTTRCENLLLFPCTLRLPIPVPCCPKEHDAMLPRAHLFSVVTSRSVASAGLLTHVTIFIRSTSIKPQCFGCLWRLHHADQTGTSGFSGSRSFLPAFLGWCRGTLVTSGWSYLGGAFSSTPLLFISFFEAVPA